MNVSKLFRIKEWLLTKLLFNLSFAFYIFYENSVHLARIALPVALICVYIISVGAFGYFINDTFDIRSDKAAGKENFSGRFSVFIRVLILIILAAAGILPCLFLQEAATDYLILVVIQLFLLMIYSAPPLRLKTNVFGPVADSLFSFVLPAVISIQITSHSFPLPDAGLLFTSCFFTWLSALGLRSIMIHQQKDFENDMLSGSKTFTKIIGIKTSEILSVAMAIIEVMAFVILMIIIGKVFWLWLLVSCSLFILTEVVIFNPKPLKNSAFYGLAGLLNIFYNYYILFAVCLALALETDGLYGIFIALFILVRFSGPLSVGLQKFYHRVLLWGYYKISGLFRRIRSFFSGR